MIGFYNYTILPTYLSLASAICGICFCFQGRPLIAVYCLLFSGIIDMFDGKIARTKKDRTPEEKAFGIQIDSLCDLVAFGVHPAIIAYALGLRWFFIPILCLYTLAAVTRLGYFNVTEEIRQTTTTEHRTEYEGLPVTFSAVILPGFFVLQLIPFFKHYIAYIYLAGLVMVGYLFVCKKVRVVRPGWVKLASLIAIGVAEAVCLVVLGILQL